MEIPQDTILINIPANAQGIARKVAYLGIERKDHFKRYAAINWMVILLDNEAEHLKSKDYQQYRMVTTEISDNNRVDIQGMMLDPASPEWAGGYPEYTFWWNAISTMPLPVVLNQAVGILATAVDENGLTKFDR
ncbi:hypothetical protein [Peijinzhouia sedimentorum]